MYPELFQENCMEEYCWHFSVYENAWGKYRGAGRKSSGKKINWFAWIWRWWCTKSL